MRKVGLAHRLGGIVLVTFALLLIVGTVSGQEEEGLQVSDLLYMLILGGPSGAGGVYLYVKGRKKRTSEWELRQDQAILMAASANDGVISSAELARSTGMSVAEAEGALVRFHMKSGSSDIEVGASGETVYHIPGRRPSDPSESN